MARALSAAAGAVLRAHHVRHAPARASSSLRVNAAASQIALVDSLSGRLARSAPSAAGSASARRTMSTYSSPLRAIQSPSPSVESTLAVDRDGGVASGQVTTGTPCQSISRVVVAPEKGRGSSAMSTAAISRRNTAGVTRAAVRTRGAWPSAAWMRACARPAGTPTTTRIAEGTASSTRDQSASVASVSFAPLLNEPSVG